MNAPTTTTTATPTLQERAAAAWHDLQLDRNEREAAEARRQQEYAATMLRQALIRNLDIETQPTGDRITVEGMTFTTKRGNLFLLQPCHLCGQEAWAHISDLSDLGYALESTPECIDFDRHAELRAAERVTCGECNGRGRNYKSTGDFGDWFTCPTCKGTGTVPAHAGAAQDVQQQGALERLGQALLDVLTEQGYISAHQE